MCSRLRETEGRGDALPFRVGRPFNNSTSGLDMKKVGVHKEVADGREREECQSLEGGEEVKRASLFCEVGVGGQPVAQQPLAVLPNAGMSRGR